MSAERYIQLPWDGHVHVQVLTEQWGWVEGWLMAWRRERDRWEGYVVYAEEVGHNRLGWFSRDRLRQLDSP